MSAVSCLLELFFPKLRVVLTGAPVSCTGNLVDTRADIKAIPGICPCESSACGFFPDVCSSARAALSSWLVPQEVSSRSG